MNTIPVPKAMREFLSDYRAQVIGAPDGSLDGDGSTPDKAFAIEALIGQEDGRPAIRWYWRLTDEELEQLKAGAVLEMGIYLPFMPVHWLQIQPGDDA